MKKIRLKDYFVPFISSLVVGRLPTLQEWLSEQALAFPHKAGALAFSYPHKILLEKSSYFGNAPPELVTIK
jgi:hypothetical protein